MALALALGLVASLVACSSDGSESGGSDDGGGEATTTADVEAGDTSVPDDEAPEVERPEGPAATIGEELTGGRGISLVSAQPANVADAGYTEAEYPASGTATAYESVGELPTDGTFELEPSTTADFTTRIVVRRPEAPADFNGTVVVEWLNVSSGADAGPDYTYLEAELLRGGYAWVGVSAQRIGIEGGPVAVEAPGSEMTGAGKGLRAFDPERYGDLAHPGDAYSYDIYTQIGRALRAGGDTGPLADLDVEQLLAVGESQSAFALTTYANGVQPLTQAFDGFLIHSRGGAAAPLGAPDAGIDIAGTIGGAPTTIRTDLDVPTMIVQTETDVLGLLNSYPARQDDTDRIRLWEVAGTAHADAFQLGSVEELLGCTKPVNRGQQSFVLKAALRALDGWAAGGDAPPEAERLTVEDGGGSPTYAFDDVGNVAGGIRTPAVDAPVDVLSGLPVDGASVICILMGSTTPIPADQLADRYADRAAYETAYTDAADAAITAGFILEDDRDALLADASPDRLPA